MRCTAPVAAWCHFSLQDYMDPNIPTKGFFTNVRYMFDLRDVVVDVQGKGQAAVRLCQLCTLDCQCSFQCCSA